MNTKNWLGGLLAVQLALAAGLALNTLRERSVDTSAPLLDFATTDVDRIVIDDNASKSTTLALDGESWELESLNGLPANQSKTRSLLESLAALKTTTPVVSTAAGRERFEVTEDNFQRRLRLYDGEELLGEYYFGTSPGFRRTHGRRADDDAVYALSFNNFDLPGDSNDWLDKTLLSSGDATTIKGPDFELSLDGDAWTLADAADGDAQLDAAKANELVSALESLRVLRAEDGLPEGERIVIEVATEDASYHYEFATANDKYYVKRSDLDGAFTISKTDYDRIAGKDRAALLTDPAASTQAEPDEANA